MEGGGEPISHNGVKFQQFSSRKSPKSTKKIKHINGKKLRSTPSRKSPKNNKKINEMFQKIKGKRGAIRDHKFNESRKLTEISRKDPEKIETEVSKKINIEDDVNEIIEEKKIRKHDMMKKNERKSIEENTKKLLVKKPTEENYFEEKILPQSTRKLESEESKIRKHLKLKKPPEKFKKMKQSKLTLGSWNRPPTNTCSTTSWKSLQCSDQRGEVVPSIDEKLSREESPEL